VFLGAALVLCFAFTSTAVAQFSGLEWVPDTSNTPEQDKSGSGNTPSTINATDNQGTYRFRISTSNNNKTQRQEWKFERRSGYTQMQTEFRINSSDSGFHKISVVQNHDDQTGSKGVFTIYQVRRRGDDWVFGVQGDTTEASNGYSNFSTVPIKLDKYYRLKIRSFIDGRNNSMETAELYDGGDVIWRETVYGGGDVESYYKMGVYRLSGGFGPVAADFRNTRFWTGQEPTNDGDVDNAKKVVQLLKSNATDFAIDGNRGSANRQSIYLWSENSANTNQQWIELNRGNGYYSYQKLNTSHCIDGNRGGANEQDVYLWECDDSNFNQHWLKVDVGDGAYKLIKRNATGFALHGGSSGANRQNVDLHDASSDSQNLQWRILELD